VSQPPRRPQPPKTCQWLRRALNSKHDEISLTFPIGPTFLLLRATDNTGGIGGGLSVPSDLCREFDRSPDSSSVVGGYRTVGMEVETSGTRSRCSGPVKPLPTDRQHFA
jgi:hypothetical protein